MRSFHTRIVLAFVGVNLAIVLLFAVILSLSLSKKVRSHLDEDLLATARTQIGLDDATRPPGGLHAPIDLPRVVRPQPGRVIAIIDGNGQVIDRAGPHPEASLPVFATTLEFITDAHPAFRTARFAGRWFRFVSYPIPGPLGLGGVILVGTSQEELGDLLPSVFQLTLMVGLASIVLSGLLGWLLARWVLSPIEEIALTARQVGEHNLTARIPELGRGDELSALTASLNAMLDRLGGTLAAQRQFLSDASHEIRTPLTILKGHLEVTLRRPRQAAEYRECLETLAAEVTHLEGLVRNLLWIARSEAAGVELDLAEVEIDPWLAEVVGRHAKAVEERGGHLVLELHSGVHRAIDPDRLRQVIDNLLANGIRFTPAGGKLRVTCQDDGGLTIAVEDAGPGIAPAEREAIFGRFYRVDDARNRASGGAGLGLAIARDIARAHGGDLWVEGAPAGGSRFVLRL
jgi:two-component system OmpR family sensor kinase